MRWNQNLSQSSCTWKLRCPWVIWETHGVISVLYLLRLLALQSITCLLPRAQGSVPPSSSSPSSGTKKERGYAAGESGHVCMPGFQSKIGKPFSICSACHLRGSFPHKTFSLYFHQVNVSSAERGASWKCKKKTVSTNFCSFQLFAAALFFTLIFCASSCWKETSDSLSFPSSGQVPALPTTACSPGLSCAEESLRWAEGAVGIFSAAVRFTSSWSPAWKGTSGPSPQVTH